MKQWKVQVPLKTKQDKEMKRQKDQRLSQHKIVQLTIQKKVWKGQDRNLSN